MSIDLGALGWDADHAGQFAVYGRSGCRPGRVSRVDRGIYPVLTVEGTVRASAAGRLLGTAARDLLQLPVAGDWVAVRDWPDGRSTVEAVLPRRTVVVRQGAGRDSLGQLLAANVDTAAVVEPLDPAPDPARVERLLALLWESGATPVLILTKADMVADPVALAEQLAAVAPGVAVHAVCGTDPESLRPLAGYVTAGRTLGLFGTSGVGKSTLVNTLVGTSVLATRALRADGRGRHTTTYRALVPVPGGGAVLDIPGLRSVGLDDSAEGLDRTFADVLELAGHCRFSDCRHDTEPDCAVRAALEDGTLSPRRLASWHKLQAELRWQAGRRRSRLAATERAEGRGARSWAHRRADPRGLSGT